ncbi:hypothetical protein CTM83_17710 [Photobacterium leiognathi subsp. mandapamensis]|nr:hypothetical protein CTM83_17710 [Photobacterium leiognathi subsp. mandapamensis]
MTRSQRVSVLSSQTLLTILNVEPLHLQIVAAPENQGRLAEHCILRLLGYKVFYKKITVNRQHISHDKQYDDISSCNTKAVKAFVLLKVIFSLIN